MNDRDIYQELGENLYHMLKEKCPVKSEVVFFCIGTEKVKGDNIGPLIGSLLKEEEFLAKYHVKGFLGDNITAMNIREKIKEVSLSNTFIIAIDATISNKKPGTILLRKGSLIPGLGLGKKLKEVGDISIMPVIGNSKEKEDVIKLIENIPKDLIENVSKTVSESIFYAMKKFEQYRMEKNSSTKIKFSDALRVKTYPSLFKTMFFSENVKKVDMND